MLELHRQLETVQTKDDLSALVRALQHNLKDHPEEWENDDLSSYLEAMAAWIDDTRGYFKNMGETSPEYPTWKAVGQMLLAASAYE